MIYARERDDTVLRNETAYKTGRIAAMLQFDLEAEELARELVKYSRHPISVKNDGVYLGAKRSEMATRAYDLDPVKFTEAVYHAGYHIKRKIAL